MLKLETSDGDGINWYPQFVVGKDGTATATGKIISGQGFCINNDCKTDWSQLGDNLGNHIATQNIQLNGNWLSNDGDNEGLYIDDDGNVGIGTTSPTQIRMGR